MGGFGEPDGEAKTVDAASLRPAAPAVTEDRVDLHIDDEPTSEVELSRYRVKDVLGIGGMGEVRRCRDQRIGRDVALKVMHQERWTHPQSRERFMREARLQGQLEHPAIVPVYDLAEDGGAPYFTMKRVRGLTLHDVLLSPQGLARRRRLLDAFHTACLAVEYAHRRGVIHRDLKPDNIMLGDFGEVYVLDWGIARVAGEPDDPRPDDKQGRTPSGLDLADLAYATQAGDVMGTPAYMAPEQVLGRPADAQADVYALGVVLFEILTGTPLRQAVETTSHLLDALSKPPPRPSERAPERDIPPELDELCHRALALEPDERVASARELADGIQRYLDGDRDLALRRERAEAHLARAEAQLPAALDGDEAARSDVGREVFAAMTLDPSHHRAREVLLKLLTDPPAVLPAEAQRALEEEDERLSRRHAWTGVWANLAVIFLGLPVALFLTEVREWGSFSLMFGSCAASALFSYLGTRPGERRWLFIVLSLLTALVAAATSSRVFGPHVMVPTILLAATVVFGLHPRSWLRTLAWGSSVVVMLLLSLLELSGWFAPTYLGQRSGFVARFAMLEVGGDLGLVISAGFVCFFIAFVGRRTGRMFGELDKARARTQWQAWQLRNLLPKDVADVAVPRFRTIRKTTSRGPK